MSALKLVGISIEAELDDLVERAPPLFYLIVLVCDRLLFFIHQLLRGSVRSMRLESGIEL